MSRHYTDLETRKEIVRLYQENRFTERDIARELNVSASTVHYWIERYNSEGNVDVKPKTGRPRITDRTIDRQILETSDDQPFLAATEIQRELHLNCHPQTVRNRLKEGGMRSRRPARKDILYDVHKEKRLRFARSHEDWTAETWNRVIFSDEKLFYSSGYGPVRIWRPQDADRFDAKYIAPKRDTVHRFKINVWACISGTGHNFIHLIQIPYLDRHYYVDHILQPILGPIIEEDDIIFMQDLAPIHTSHRAKEWLDANNVNWMTDWPPKGPDLNPIENVWAEMERILRYRTGTMRRRDELWMQVVQAFEDLTTNEAYMIKLIGSLPRRLNSVIAKLGGWTKY